jgi:hypothetical protein
VLKIERQGVVDLPIVLHEPEKLFGQRIPGDPP